MMDDGEAIIYVSDKLTAGGRAPYTLKYMSNSAGCG